MPTYHHKYHKAGIEKCDCDKHPIRNSIIFWIILITVLIIWNQIK